MTTLPLVSVLLSVVPCLGIVWLSSRWSQRGTEVMVAIARMVIQLLAIGFALLFIFQSPSLWVGAGVVVVMLTVSSIIGVRLVRNDRRIAFQRAVISLGLAGVVVLAFILIAVLQMPDQGYQPRLMIPIAGMIFANAMTAITLAAERFQKEMGDHHDYPLARSAAWSAALIPQVNALLAVGLVSLPGMMTGQILAGVDPLIAVRYQIVVMAMLLQASGLSVAIFLWLYQPRR